MTTDESWQAKVLRKTGANRTKLGMIACAVLGHPLSHPPMISMKRGAVIDEDGWVLADVWLPGRAGFLATNLGSLRDIVDNFRRLADILKLSDEDRAALFVLMQKWMGTDLRARGKNRLDNW